MIGYTMLGSNDLEKASAFYDVIFDLLGEKKLYTSETFIAWGQSQAQPMFCITKPFDGNKACVGNGVMIALRAESKDKVDLIHKKALLVGAENEGDPGIRQGGYYCAYFRDLDGNKLNIYFFGS